MRKEWIVVVGAVLTAIIGLGELLQALQTASHIITLQRALIWSLVTLALSAGAYSFVRWGRPSVETTQGTCTLTRLRLFAAVPAIAVLCFLWGGVLLAPSAAAIAAASREELRAPLHAQLGFALCRGLQLAQEDVFNQTEGLGNSLYHCGDASTPQALTYLKGIVGRITDTIAMIEGNDDLSDDVLLIQELVTIPMTAAPAPELGLAVTVLTGDSSRQARQLLTAVLALKRTSLQLGDYFLASLAVEGSDNAAFAKTRELLAQSVAAYALTIPSGISHGKAGATP